MRAFWCLLAFVLACAPAPAAAEKRIALVIGNSRYAHADVLPNPANDARAIAAALERLDFEVDLRLDLDQPATGDAFRAFGLAAEAADVAMVYYAGHGIQVGGENYLLPVDAVLQRERDLIYEALPLAAVLGEVAQARRLGLIVLDACRDNPLAERLRQALGPVRSLIVGTGLARVEQLPRDTMVAFSTRPGELAADGQGEHSPYAQALLRHLEEPGVELTLLFRKVRDTVLELTAQRQEPRFFDALGAEPFHFKAPLPNRQPLMAAVDPLELQDAAAPVPLGIPAPVDPDGDPVTAQVLGLPMSGTVSVADRPLAIGDELTVAELTGTTYRPTGDYAGHAGSFDFLIKDDRGGTVIRHVAIRIAGTGQPTVVAPASSPATGAEATVARAEPENVPPPSPDEVHRPSEPARARERPGDAEAAVAEPAPTDQAEPAGEPEVAQLTLTRRAPPLPDPGAAAGTTFQDCEPCPVMVVVPGGTYTMGSRLDEEQRFIEEGPAHEVRVGRFALGRTEVTTAEFAAFVEATGHAARGCSVSTGEWRHAADKSWTDPGFEQDAEHPVVCVSWHDAQAYVAWLSERTGHDYRLPSEAEWEYAARAGTRTARYWGDDPEQACGFANGADLATRERYADWTTVACRDGFAYTAPAGALEGNAFGLHDMIGNAWEWVADCWHTSHWGAPADGSVRAAAADCERTIRGGSWYNGPWLMRAAARKGYPPDTRFFSAGFRVARSLDEG